MLLVARSAAAVAHKGMRFLTVSKTSPTSTSEAATATRLLARFAAFHDRSVFRS